MGRPRDLSIKYCPKCEIQKSKENSYINYLGNFKNSLCNKCFSLKKRKEYEDNPKYRMRLIVKNIQALFQPLNSTIKSNEIVESVLTSEDGSIVFSLGEKTNSAAVGGLLPQRVSAMGYYVFDFNGKQYKTHRIVCSAFNGPTDKLNWIVNHKDLNKLNNHYRNLEWCTYMHNNRHWMLLKGVLR